MCLIVYNDCILGHTNSERQMILSLILGRKTEALQVASGSGSRTQVSMYQILSPYSLATLLTDFSTERASSAFLTVMVT